MKRVLLLSLAVSLALATGAWAQDSAEPAVKAQYRSVVERFFAALQAHNYPGMRDDFSDTLKAKLPASVFQKDDAKSLPETGELTSWKISGWVRDGDVDMVLAEATYAKGVQFQYKFVFGAESQAAKITGLWKKPLAQELNPEEAADFVQKYGGVAQRYLAAIKANNFRQATTEFSDRMLEALGPSDLQKVVEGKTRGFGELKSWEFSRAVAEGEFVSLYYRAKYANGQVVNYKIVFMADDEEKKIGGLWLKPLDAPQLDK